MVIFIALGCLAFICFAIFDLNKIKFMYEKINLLVVLGSIDLSFCTIAIIISDSSTKISTPLQWLELLLAMIALILLIYTIFGAVQFKETYIETGKRNTVVSTGVYAFCRHPGVFCFFFFYLFLGLAFNNNVLLTAAFLWTSLDVIYVYIQDRWIFPIILKDYQTYQEQVPFLIPNKTSLRHGMSSMLGKGD
jgi:protein-S-isoprenylcysteine O-methyltransferase Ste14